MNEPYRSLFAILTANGHPYGRWHYNVKLTHGAIYIGTNAHHFTVLSAHAGYHVTINGNHSGQIAANLYTLLRTRWDVTPAIGRALEWFRQHENDGAWFAR